MGFDDSGKKPVTVGPWGGSGGSRWDDGMYSTVRQLLIVHGAGIDSIKIEYDQKGCSIWSDKHGGSGGYKTDTVKLDYPDEYLTSVHGHYGSLFWLGPTFVRSLSFESNKKKYGPFGVETGTYFSFPITGGKIVGFHGRCGWYLDAIGVYLKPLQQQNPTNGLLHSQKNQGFDDSGKKPVTVGPWGGSGGSRWDDGMYSTVRQLLIVHGAGIDSIKIEYDQKGCSIWSDKHGGSGGYKTDTLNFFP